MDKFDDFINYARQYDFVRPRCCSFCGKEKTISTLIIALGPKAMIFAIVFNEQKTYRIIKDKKSKVSFPKRLSGMRFETPEKSLDFLVNYLLRIGIKLYSSNAENFIMSLTEDSQ